MLSRVSSEIYKCMKCGWCREEIQQICPAREVLGFESSFGRGRVALARGILEGEFYYNDKLIERMYTCLGCASCKVHCPLEVDTIEIFRAHREDAVEKGIPLPKSLEEINRVIEENKNPFGKSPELREKLAESFELPSQGEVFYFGGCYDSYRLPQDFKNTVYILRKIGINPAYLAGDEWCCGLPQIWNGSTDLARKLAKHNIEALKKAGAKQVITSCSGCFNAFGRFYRQVLGEFHFEVIHITEFLANKLKSGQLRLKDLDVKYPGNITYHDPCHLGRHMGVYEEPRILLQQMFPKSFREMSRNREKSWCCGGGAVVFPYLTQYSLEIAGRRIKEAVDTGVNMIITTCPTCINVLKIPARKHKIDVKNLLDLLVDAVV